MNHMGSFGVTYTCNGNGVGENTVCENCQTPQTIYGTKMNSDGSIGGAYPRNMKVCSDSSLKPSSFKREKYLGRGWTINYLENRFKDPTPLIMQPYAPTFEHISEMGIKSLSVVADNNEQGLILPSMFKINTDTRLDIPLHISSNMGWNYQTSYSGFNIQSSNSYIRQQSFITQHYNDNDASNPDVYMAYTKNLEPVLIRYFVDSSASIPYSVIPMEITYRRSDGITFYYNHYVPYCYSFDDLGEEGQCASSELSDPKTHWAENPYAGIYPKEIIDTFGNRIKISYRDNLWYENSPLIDTISVAGAMELVEFNYDDTQIYDIDTKLDSIEYSGGDGGTIFRRYEYTPMNGAKLLTRTFISESEYEGPIIGTVYEYEYDPVSQELIRVKLPTGAEIEYEYGWAEEIPSIDAVRGYMQSSSPYNDMPRRVIIKRTLRYGGECNGLDICTWEYKYNSEDMITTVTDPLGQVTKHYWYPSTTTTLNN